MTPILPAGTAGAAVPCAAPGAAARPAISFDQLLERARGPCPTSAHGPPADAGRGGGNTGPSPRPPQEASPIRRALDTVERARARLDGVLAEARAGRVFTAQELLGLQAEAYRTVQTIDLSVKVAEQGAQSVRQALQAQV
jgi:hypothetical protein